MRKIRFIVILTLLISMLLQNSVFANAYTENKHENTSEIHMLENTMTEEINGIEVINFQTQEELDKYYLDNDITDDNVILEIPYMTKTRSMGVAQLTVKFISNTSYILTVLNLGSGTMTNISISGTVYNNYSKPYASFTRYTYALSPFGSYKEYFNWPGAVYINRITVNASFSVDGFYYSVSA